jgi:hypothetical protein
VSVDDWRLENERDAATAGSEVGLGYVRIGRKP